jgi:glutaredoxin 3
MPESSVPEYELFGTGGCPYTQDLREWLDGRGYSYVEYDVESDPDARKYMIGISGGQRTVPVLVADGVVVQVGWQGRGCMVAG